MVSFEVLTRLRELGLPYNVWNIVRRGEASQLRAAFRLGVLDRSIRRGTIFEQASDTALPSIRTIWDRTHRKFKNLTGLTVPVLFDQILGERPLVLANAVVVAYRKLQSRIEKAMSKEDTSLQPYLRRRLKRYEEKPGKKVSPPKKGLYRNNDPVLARCNEVWSTQAKVFVENRDKAATFKFFMNGWFTDRRFQGRKRATGVKPCPICEMFLLNQAIVAISANDPTEDSTDHFRFCDFLTWTACKLGFIPNTMRANRVATSSHLLYWNHVFLAVSTDRRA